MTTWRRGLARAWLAASLVALAVCGVVYANARRCDGARAYLGVAPTSAADEEDDPAVRNVIAMERRCGLTAYRAGRAALVFPPMFALVLVLSAWTAQGFARRDPRPTS